MRSRNILISGLVLTLLLVPAVVQAQIGGPVPQFQNPIRAPSIPALLGVVTWWILSIVGFIALFALVFGGLRFILAFGDEKAVASAKEIIKWSVVGLAVIALSFAIVQWVTGVLGVQ
jgi:hypothetical protein